MGIEQSDVYLMLKPRSEWRKGLTKAALGAEITELLEKEVPEAAVALSQPIQMRTNELIAGVRSDVAAMVYGPDLDKLKDGQALLEFLASKCVPQKAKGQTLDVEFLNKVRDVCMVEAQEVPTKAPPMFKPTFTKFAGDFDRMAQAWGACFRKMNKESKKDDLESFDKAWVQSLNASTEIRKIGKSHLSDE
jgi:hypothetical protein